MILKISQTMPTIRDLFFVPCNAVSDIAAMATKRTTSKPSPKATFFCKIQQQKAHQLYVLCLTNKLSNTFGSQPCNVTYPVFTLSINEEDSKIRELQNKPNSINGDHKKAVWVNKWHAIQTPEQAVQHCCNVRVRLEFLHRLFLNDSVKCWTAFQKISISQFIIDRVSQKKKQSMEQVFNLEIRKKKKTNVLYHRAYMKRQKMKKSTPFS